MIAWAKMVENSNECEWMLNEVRDLESFIWFETGEDCRVYSVFTIQECDGVILGLSRILYA